MENLKIHERQFISQVSKKVDDNLRDEAFGTNQLCGTVFLSRSQLYRKMKSLFGFAPSDYIRIRRLNKAKQLIESGQYSIGEVSYMTGFSSLAYFSKVFKEHFGVTPSHWKK